MSRSIVERDLCDPRLDRFRLLSSIYTPALFRAHTVLLKFGLKGESIETISAGGWERTHPS